MAVLSINTIVFGSSGTACMIPASVSRLSPGQNANSDRWATLMVNDRPTP